MLYRKSLDERSPGDTDWYLMSPRGTPIQAYIYVSVPRPLGQLAWRHVPVQAWEGLVVRRGLKAWNISAPSKLLLARVLM